MVTLASDTPLASISEILEAALTLSPAVWTRQALTNGDPMALGDPPNLSRDIVDLFALLRDRRIPYLLVGGVALLRYIEGRNTKDVDLLLPPKSLKDLPEVVIANQDADFARGTFRALQVDLLLTSNPLFRVVHERHATLHHFQELDVRCATVEGLVLLKLYALPALYRQGDGQRIALYEADLTMLMERHRPNLEPLLAVIEPHVDPGQFHELRNIVSDIQKRIDRIRKDHL